MLRRCVWSRNIKNGCSIYIYDISRLRVNTIRFSRLGASFQLDTFIICFSSSPRGLDLKSNMKFADVCGMIPIIFSPLDCFRLGACRQFNVTGTKAYCMMSLQQKPCQSQVASNQPFLQAYCSLILRSVESHRDRFYIIRNSGQGPVSFCDRFPLSKVLQFAPCLLLDSILNGRWQVWWRRYEVNAIGNPPFLTLTLRLLMSYIYIYIYIYGAPILDVSRSYTTTQHSR